MEHQMYAALACADGYAICLGVFGMFCCITLFLCRSVVWDQTMPSVGHCWSFHEPASPPLGVSPFKQWHHWIGLALSAAWWPCRLHGCQWQFAWIQKDAPCNSGKGDKSAQVLWVSFAGLSILKITLIASLTST